MNEYGYARCKANFLTYECQGDTIIVYVINATCVEDFVAAKPIGFSVKKDRLNTIFVLEDRLDILDQQSLYETVQYRAALKIQKMFRHFYWRKHTLYNPHTEVGNHRLRVLANLYCKEET